MVKLPGDEQSWRLEKMGAPPWARGLGVAVLALILVGKFALFTFSLTAGGDPL